MQYYFEELEDQIDLEEPRESCTLTTTMHYSFDFAQQVHIPSNPMQPRPIYFKTLRKCAIFGVMCKAIPWQVNYLVDEASDVGKGANTTISYVHHYFKNHGLGETSAHLHADNCSRQNKNNYFMWYLAWRTILQLHYSIRYSFLIAGHQIWSRSLFWHHQKILTIFLHYTNLPIWWSRQAPGLTKHSLWGHTTEQSSSWYTTGLHFLNSSSKRCQI